MTDVVSAVFGEPDKPRRPADPGTPDEPGTPDGPDGPGTPDGPAPRRLPPSIVVRDVRAAYGRIEVLHGVDLVVPPGSVFALLGPNGAGKSTLLKVINGRMRPSSGDVLVGDDPVGKSAPEKLVSEACAPSPRVVGSSPT